MTSKAEQLKIDSKYLRGDLAESLQNPVTGAVSADSHNLIKFHGIYEQDDRDCRDRRAEKKLEKLYSFMIRLRIPGGRISSKQWLGIDDIANHNSTKVIKVTTRQTVQLHGVVKAKLKPTVAWFDKYGLDSIAACGDVNRNVISSSAIPKSKGADEVYDYAKKIAEHLLPKTNAYNEIWLDGEKVSPEDEEEPIYGQTYLPRKFKVALATPPDNDVDVYAHDIGLIAIINKGDLQGFNVVVGGGLGMTHGNENTYPRKGDIIGYVTKDKLIDTVEKIVTVQRDFGNREDRKLARLKYTIDKFGLDWFTGELEKRLNFKLEKAKDFKFSKRQDCYNWDQDYSGKYHYTLFIENGRIYDDKNYKIKTALLEIAKSGKANFRFTNNQNIVISDVLEKDKKLIDKILADYKINNENISNLRINALACVALPTCPQALAEGQRYMPDLISKIEPLLTKYRLDNEQITIRMTGCPNGCARPYLAEIGLVGKSAGKYNLYLAGSNVGERLNRLYKEDLEEDDILNELNNLFKLYQSNKKANETFGDFTLREVKFNQQ